jgi:hypothetical protein
MDCFLLFCVFSIDPERWTNIPLLVKIFKLIINELSSVVEANATRATASDWSQGSQTSMVAVALT